MKILAFRNDLASARLVCSSLSLLLTTRQANSHQTVPASVVRQLSVSVDMCAEVDGLNGKNLEIEISGTPQTSLVALGG